MIDLSALDAAVFARLATDSQGAAVRALLGAGAAGVLMAEDLRVEGLRVLSLPTRPIVALRRGATPLLGRVVNMPIYTWYAYDDPAVGYGRLASLIQAIGDAYIAVMLPADVAVGSVEVSAGPQTRDATLGLLLSSALVAIGAV